MRESKTADQLIREGCPKAPATFGLAPAWRRGMMHAAERIDLILNPRKPLPRGRAALTALAEIRDALDDLTKLQRESFPASYEEAFRICADDLARAQRRDRSAA